MPNPACLVNGVTPPVVVGGSSTLTIALANVAGAEFWSILATGSDETSSIAAINASLVVNQTNKTATCTAPGAGGTAVIFTSVVGVSALGLDANGNTVAAYTTTFKIDVPTSGGRRVLALNETLEEGTFGWIREINDVIRNGGGSSFNVGGTGIVHVTANVPDATALHGTADQLFGENHAGTDTAFFTLGGDATLASGTLTLATVNPSPGSYGDANDIPVLTVDGKGRITAIASVPAGRPPPIGMAIGLVTHLSATVIPSGYVVSRCSITITTAYSVGATIKVGTFTSNALLMDTGDSVPQTLGSTFANFGIVQFGSSSAIQVTIGGSPTVGACHVLVEYSLPSS